MTQPKIVSTTYAYRVDQESVVAVQSANAKVVSGLQAIRAAADADYSKLVNQYSAAADAAASSTVDAAERSAKAFTDVEAAASRAGRAIHDIGVQSQRELPEPSLSAFGVDEAGGGRGAGDTFRQASQAAIALPGVGFQSPLVLGLRAAGLAADKTGASLATVGLALGAVAVLGLAYSALTEQAEKTSNALRESKNVFYEVQVGAANQTKEQLTAQRDAAQRTLDAQKKAYDEAADEYAAYVNAHPLLLFVQNADVVKNNDSSFTSLKGNYEDQKALLDQDTQALAAANTAIDNNATAAYDAAEAEKQLADAREKYASDLIGQFQDETNLRLDLARLRREGTSEQLDNRIQANNDEIAIIQNFLLPSVKDMGLSTQAAADKVTQLNERIEFLGHSNDLLRESIEPVITQREREAAAAEQWKDAIDNQFTAQTKAGEAMERTQQALENLADAAQEHADKLVAIDADYNDKLIDISEKASKSADDAREKAAQKAEEQQRKHLERIAEIDRQFAIDSESAVGNRDALALYQAQQKHTEDLTKEQTAYDEQQKALQDNLDEQLKNIRENLAEQVKSAQEAQRKAIESENRAYQKRQQQLQEALQKAQLEQSRADGLALGYQRQANDAQLNERIRANNAIASTQQSAHAQQQSAEVVHQNTVSFIVASGAVTIENNFQTMMNNLAAIALGNPGNVGHGGAGGGGGGGGGGFFAGGHSIQRIVDQRIAQITKDANR